MGFRVGMRVLFKSVIFSSLAMLPIYSYATQMYSGVSTSTQTSNQTSLSSMDFDCVINPSKVADLGAKVPGVISNFFVENNQRVKANQLLAKINSEVEQAELAVAKERYQATNTEISMRKASVDLSQRQYARSLDAFKGDALSRHDLDVSETELQLSKIHLKQAQAKQKIQKKELAKAQAMLNRKKIIAPFSGVILERFKVEGELVNDEPVMRIAKLNPLIIDVILSEEYIAELKHGMQANVWKKQQESQIWKAKVVHVDQILDPASSTFAVRLELPNVKYDISAGMQCQINFLPNNKI